MVVGVDVSVVVEAGTDAGEPQRGGFGVLAVKHTADSCSDGGNMGNNTPG